MRLRSLLLTVVVAGGCSQPSGRSVDLGGDAAPPPAPLGDHAGQVALASQSQPQPFGGLVASFWNERGQSCTFDTMGSCGISHCTAKTAGAPPLPTAGAISVSGTLIALGSTPDANGAYAPVSQPDQAWSGGESITLSAAGADVAAFTATLTAPTTVTVTAPTGLAAGATVPRATDLALAWSGTSAGVVVASFQSGGVQIECRFAPTAMQGVVPAAVLQQLPAAMGTLSLSSTTQSRLPAGTSTVDVTLRSLAIGADGHVVGGNVTFQ